MVCVLPASHLASLSFYIFTSLFITSIHLHVSFGFFPPENVLSASFALRSFSTFDTTCTAGSSSLLLLSIFSATPLHSVYQGSSLEITMPFFHHYQHTHLRFYILNTLEFMHRWMRSLVSVLLPNGCASLHNTDIIAMMQPLHRPSPPLLIHIAVAHMHPLHLHASHTP